MYSSWGCTTFLPPVTAAFPTTGYLRGFWADPKTGHSGRRSPLSVRHHTNSEPLPADEAHTQGSVWRLFGSDSRRCRPRLLQSKRFHLQAEHRNRRSGRLHFFCPNSFRWRTAPPPGDWNNLVNISVTESLLMTDFLFMSPFPCPHDGMVYCRMAAPNKTK